MIKNIPKHVACIPDANRRWARARGLPPWEGHREGIKRLEEVLEEAHNLEIPYFTFWGTSYDNIIKRSKKEVEFLFHLFEKVLTDLLKNKRVHKEKVRIRVLGFWEEMFPEKLKQLINKVIRATKDYNHYHLTILLAYNGDKEILRALNKIIHHNPSLKRITPGVLKQNLFTKDLPPVDYVIRTGGEPHNSAGFMMWDTADSQYYFTETCWPDFGKEEFRKAIEEFGKRGRRYGA